MEPCNSSAVACSGWLQKRSPVLRDTWQPHWCIVQSASLSCYEHQDSEVAKATWDLTAAQVSAFSDADAPGDAAKHREARPHGLVLDLGSTVRLSHQRFVHFDAEQAESLAQWLACFEALKADRAAGGEEEVADNKVSSPKSAYNVRKRTFLYRKHSYRARKPRAPPGRVTASLPDEPWVDVAPSRSEGWLSAWRGVHESADSFEMVVQELPEEKWKPAEDFAAEGVEEVTAVIRSGLDPEDRSGAWPLLAASAAKRKSKGRPYESLVADGKALEDVEAVRTIQADLHRTGMENVDVCSLENVLLSFAAANPDIGYCQSMSFVAATLLHYLPEETAFWTLSGLLEDVLPEGYFASRMVGLRTDLRVLNVLLQQYLPELAEHLETQEIDLSPITVNWFLCLFLNTLPPKWSHRVLDTVLYEGSVTLFRLALAILNLRSSELLKCTSIPDAFVYLRSPCDCRGIAKAAEGAELWELMFAEWLNDLSEQKLNRLRREQRRNVEAEDAKAAASKTSPGFLQKMSFSWPDLQEWSFPAPSAMFSSMTSASSWLGAASTPPDSPAAQDATTGED